MLTVSPEEARRFGTKSRWHSGPVSLQNRAGIPGSPIWGQTRTFGDRTFDRLDLRKWRSNRRGGGGFLAAHCAADE